MKTTLFFAILLFITLSSCKPDSCSDEKLNQNETGVDCGGVCTACPTCSDGIKNQEETDIDCGGPCDLCAIEYPTSGTYGVNILDTANTTFAAGSTNHFSMRATLPEGTSIKVKLTLLTAVSGTDLWFYTLGTSHNLVISQYDNPNDGQTFQSIEANNYIELDVTFMGEGTATLEIFENNATTSTYSKTIGWS